MKVQKQNQVTVPKIEIDLSRIQQLSREHDENWDGHVVVVVGGASPAN
jgi:hypothetical protein